MYSVFVRFYKVVNFIIPSITLLLIGSYFISTLEPQKGTPECRLENVRFHDVRHVPKTYASDPHDLVDFTFNLECDVTPLWHWNTKMLYIYMTASFVDTKGVKSELTVWDRRINNENECIINLHNAISPYGLVTNEINTMPVPPKDVTFSVHVSETPFGGMMRYYDVGEEVGY